MPNNKWDTSLYEQKHAFVFEYGKGLIPLLQPQPGELILDLGCGTGHLTHTIAESGAHVIGIDSSVSMIEIAQVARCIAASLKPGDRFVAEFGGKDCVATMRTAVQESFRELMHREIDFGWYFPSIGEYASLLEKHNLDVRSALLFERPTPLTDGEMGLRNWIQMFGERVFHNVPDDVKQHILERTEEKTRDRLFNNGQWIADYTRLRIMAYKA